MLALVLLAAAAQAPLEALLLYVQLAMLLLAMLLAPILRLVLVPAALVVPLLSLLSLCRCLLLALRSFPDTAASCGGLEPLPHAAGAQLLQPVARSLLLLVVVVVLPEQEQWLHDSCEGWRQQVLRLPAMCCEMACDEGGAVGCLCLACW